MRITRSSLVSGVQEEEGQVMGASEPRSWSDDMELEAMSWAVTGWEPHLGDVTAWTSQHSGPVD